jgi:prepilin-type N-terminal cleavage/methylation domain-containing protein
MACRFMYDRRVTMFKTSHGVTLIEIMVALAILVFGALAIIGIFSMAGRSHGTAIDAELSAEMLNEIRSDLNLMALRGEKPPNDWAVDPMKFHDSERLLYRVSAKPVGGLSSEISAIKNNTPFLYAVYIEIIPSENARNEGNLYETALIVRYDNR